MTDFDAVDFFRDRSLPADPYPYLDYLRAQCPVQREPHHDVVMVTGYDEAIAVYSDTATFSSCNSVTGPFAGVPGPARGRRRQRAHRAAPRRAAVQRPAPGVRPAEAHRAPRAAHAADHAEAAQGERGVHVARSPIARSTSSSPRASASSSASSRRRSRCSSSPTCSASPRRTTRRSAQLSARARPTRRKGGELAHKPLEFLYEQFTAYIEDRRREPRDDVMTGLATATFPDGSVPEVHDVALIAANLFVGGPGDHGAAARRPRCRRSASAPTSSSSCASDRERIPNFIEEMLRLESPIQGEFRLVAGADDARRRRHPGRHDGDGAERRRQPRPAAVRGPGRAPARPRQRPPARRRSGTASTPARARHWPGPRAG